MPKYDPNAVVDMLKPGQYEGVVKRAQNKVSSKGNDMIELIVTCYGTGGQEHDVFDYLVFHPDMLYRVRHFCDSAGLDFSRGELNDADCAGRNVRVNLMIETKAGFQDKNKIIDYLPRGFLGNEQAGISALDTDIPF